MIGKAQQERWTAVTDYLRVASEEQPSAIDGAAKRIARLEQLFDRVRTVGAVEHVAEAHKEARLVMAWRRCSLSEAQSIVANDGFATEGPRNPRLATLLEWSEP